ncbi:hypothetical protein GCM10010182_80090 [Actinomadura cremea]|nr:hypothetical protein GCM10010182_80090 [Actinomadura cremea]
MPSSACGRSGLVGSFELLLLLPRTAASARPPSWRSTAPGRSLPSLQAPKWSSRWNKLMQVQYRTSLHGPGRPLSQWYAKKHGIDYRAKVFADTGSPTLA